MKKLTIQEQIEAIAKINGEAFLVGKTILWARKGILSFTIDNQLRLDIL